MSCISGMDDVRWLYKYLGRIQDMQLRAGLEASGASEKEVDRFTNAMRDRINQLGRVSAGVRTGGEGSVEPETSSAML